MNRIKVIWLKLWKDISNHLICVGSHQNVKIS